MITSVCTNLCQNHGAKHGQRLDELDLQYLHRGAPCLSGRTRSRRDLVEGELCACMWMVFRVINYLSSNLDISMQSTALELDYFNKQVQVDSDIGGGPGAVEEAEAGGKTGLPKMHLAQEPEKAEESRRLDVDKGLFRRKPQPAKEAFSMAKTKETVRSKSRNSSDDEDGGRDIEAGPRGGGRGSLFSFAFGSGKQNVQPISEQESSQSLSGLIASERRVKQPNLLPMLSEVAAPSLEGVGEKESGEGVRDGEEGPERADAAGSNEQQQHVHGRDDHRLIRYALSSTAIPLAGMRS